MITFENWFEIKNSLSGYDQARIINELIHACVQAKINDWSISYFKDRSLQIYDNGWYLQFTKTNATIYDFSFNCLKTNLFHNHQQLENNHFFRSVDLFYKFINDNKIELSKKVWLDKMYMLALASDNHKSKEFVENMDQYFAQRKLMDDMKCLIK